MAKGAQQRVPSVWWLKCTLTVRVTLFYCTRTGIEIWFSTCLNRRTALLTATSVLSGSSQPLFGGLWR